MPPGEGGADGCFLLNGAWLGRDPLQTLGILIGWTILDWFDHNINVVGPDYANNVLGNHQHGRAGPLNARPA